MVSAVTRFLQKYPVPLSELLLAPVVFRENLPQLAQSPLVTASGMRDLAMFAGHADGTVRTAMSRLRSTRVVRTSTDARGVTTYRLAAFENAISQNVRARPSRGDGLLLAIFSFEAEDVRERKVVREALRLVGFQKLAQNVYINGQIDTSELERLFEREGLAQHVYFFRCNELDDPKLQKRLLATFDVAARTKQLQAFEEDLRSWLTEPGLDAQTFARRLLYAGPVHYRITFAEEPPVPARLLPKNYPLSRLERLIPTLVEKRATAVRAWFERHDS